MKITVSTAKLYLFILCITASVKPFASCGLSVIQVSYIFFNLPKVDLNLIKNIEVCACMHKCCMTQPHVLAIQERTRVESFEYKKTSYIERSAAEAI